jgi:hypothetical protein
MAASSFVSGGNISNSNCVGNGGSSFGGWQVVAVDGVVVCRTTTAMRGVHNNQPKERCVEKMPATEAKQQATTRVRQKDERAAQQKHQHNGSKGVGVVHAYVDQKLLKSNKITSLIDVRNTGFRHCSNEYKHNAITNLSYVILLVGLPQ